MHSALGTVEEFNFNHVLGIHSPNYGKTSPGFKSIHIEPWVGGEVSWARGYLETPQGRVSVDWSKEGGDLKMDVNIPLGSTATIVLPSEYKNILKRIVGV